MKKIYSLVLLLCLSEIAFSQTTTYTTPGTYAYTVPSGVTLLSIDAKGAAGGIAGPSSSLGTATPTGLGGRVQATLTVTPGSVLNIYIGGQGPDGTSAGVTGGTNGGGNAAPWGGSYSGGGGGGATDIRVGGVALSNRILVAGGGGGGGYNGGHYGGGAGGNLVGGTGSTNPSGSGGAGGNTTTLTGGAGGGYPGYTYGSAGTLGSGGSSQLPSPGIGGGGGGGYYGGGGGGWSGGGGGSSYVDGTVTSSVTLTQGFQAGNGAMTIVVLCNAPGTISGSGTVCVGSTTTYTDPTSISGGTWISSNPAVATIGSSSGVITGVSAGTSIITYSISNPCGALATKTITVNALPEAISGTASVCIGVPVTFTDATTGGTWSSSSTTLATVGSTTGSVTGVATGTPTITYTLPTGCMSTTLITVNASPAAITGTFVVCPTLTTSLSSSPSGGIWTSSSTALATVGSSTGVVTGVSGGTPTITYTLGTGCFRATPVTVNSMSPISGVLGVCTIGAVNTLTDATSGGVWASSNPSVATIGSSTGTVTSIANGVSTITYSVPSTGCLATAVFGVTGAPNVYTVGGGGGYCFGGTGSVITLSSSDAGVSYQLISGGSPVGSPVSGAGFGVSFPPLTTAGTYTIAANYGSSCATTMTGSATIIVNALPTQFTMTGGGSYCAGGSGLHIGLSNSTIGVNYQLWSGTSMIGSPVAGTGAALDFGTFTAAGTYTATAVNATTTCFNNMLGTATISINPLPTATFTVTGGGGYCSGGSGATIGLSGSETGVNYQLLLSGSPSGSVVAGTGSAISFGSRTTGGTYTVVATNTTTTCSATMAGSATITVNVLPTVFTVTGGGAYCSGGTGVTIGLNGSTTGVNYQLYRGTTLVGGAVAGTGASLSFGLFTTAGSYTVVATNGTTGCTLNMSGSANVSINPLPTVFTVTGGGGYCAGSTGVHVGLSGSVSGFTYQLYIGASIVDAEPGTGSAIDFGLELTAGYYTVVAVDNTTGCTNNMTGGVNVVINPLPVIYTVTGGGNYCSGGAGVHIGLNSSNIGVNYQLFNGTTSSGSAVAGTGAPIDFGYRTTAGSYTVVATIAATGCTSIMSGSAAVAINPLPALFTITGGGGYCAGGTGTHVGLGGTNTGIAYQLYKDGVISGTAIAGTGTSIDFGLKTLTGTYTVIATNLTTSCTSSMLSPVIISINPLPTAYAVIGGGNYCTGGSGVHIGVGGSDTGISYQLYNGASASGSAVAGTGSSIDFGLRTAAGTYTVVATNTATGCVNTMTGSTTVGIQPLPTAFTVTGGGTYCAGGTGVHVGLNASAPGVSYQLYNASVAVGVAVAGSGAALDFGLVTGTGAYTVIATNTSTTCANNMTGSATVNTNPAPTAYFLTGGGNYCFGTTGVVIGLSGTDPGINYQLKLGGSPVGAPMPGTGGAISYGLQTSTGLYNIVATNTVTGCTQTMFGSTIVNIDPLPTTHTVTGGGNYCPGGSGIHIGLNASELGFNYQLYNGTTAVGSPVPGTGIILDFGAQTATGSYTVVATNTITTCTNGMTGSASVGLYSLPVVYNVTGSGNYCVGGTGVHVSLSGSDLGHSYQLYNTSGPVGAPMAGTGVALDFGAQPSGNYTAVATNTTTTCVNNMSGTATVGTNPLPAGYLVTGGGNYCTGGTGVHVGIAGSDIGITYQLYYGTAPSGSPVAGTGAAIDFGLKTAPGIYSVVATNNTTSCTNNMIGSAIVNVFSLPVVYNVTGGGNYCVGGTGVHIMLSGSTSGVDYQLFRGGTPVGATAPGTGAGIDFGSFTTTGLYTVVGTYTGSSCSSNMSGSATVGTNALPIAYTVTGGGNYCAGGTGVHVTLSGSNTGISYQLYVGSSPVGAPVVGMGTAIDFGLQTVAGTYTVKATNNTTGCVNNMTGSAVVGTNPLPSVYSVSSTTSNYCIGGTGVDIALTGSQTGVLYQLYHGTTAEGSPLAGTGTALDFGLHTASGIYTAVAINSTTTCSSNMASSVTVVIDPLPAAFTMTGGGSFCAGGTGVHVGLSGSSIGVQYQLYKDGVATGSPVSGIGSAIDFGLQSNSGSYTVIATNPATTCTNNMSGAAVVNIGSLPVAFSVTGGGNYCAGGTGSVVGLSGSEAGVSYQLWIGSTVSGSPVVGTGGAISFGLRTAIGSYTVKATNIATGCTNLMLGSVLVGTNALPTPFAVTGGGNYCPGGVGVHIGVAGSNNDVEYQLYNGLTAVGSPVTGYGSSIDFGLQTAAGTYTVVATNTITGCTNHMAGSSTVVLNTLPTLFTVTGGGNYCAGTGGVHVGMNGTNTGVNYQLYNGIVAVGSPVAGTGGIIDFGLLTMSAPYTVIATNATTGCSRTMSGSAVVTAMPAVTPVVNISAPGGDTICSGVFTTFTAVPTNGGTSPVYQWSVNGIVTGYSPTYSYIPLSGDVLSVTLSSSAACATPSVVSRTSTLNVIPQGTPAVSVSLNPGNEVCQGTSVNFVANVAYGGSSPSFAWMKNGVNVGSAISYSYIPSNGDDVYCVLTSNYHCRSANTASSSHTSMVVDVPVTPSVTILAFPGLNIASGQTVTFTASLNNAVIAPSYQWAVNGIPVSGATMATYETSDLANSDVVSCEVISGGGCAGLSGSASATIHVSGVGVNNVGFAGSDIKLVPNPNKGIFTISGTLGTTAGEEVTIEVTNMLGQVVYTTKVNVANGKINETVQLNNLIANGMYILNLRSTSGNKVFHLVVEQ